MRANTFTLPFILTLFFGLAGYSAFAQGAKFGKVDDHELKMNQYAQDTSAEAVVLSDIGFTKFSLNHGIQVITDRHIRIKILKKSGYDWANFEVPFYVQGGDRERVTSIKGVTYTLENGQVQKHKLEAKNVFEEQHSENWYSKKFTMPNVKVGSVIEVSYTISSDFFYNMREWEFQTTIPTLWSEYSAEIPSYFDYKFLMQGYHPLHTNNKNNKGSGTPELTNYAYTWTMKNVPALKEERYITTLKDYQSKIEFELQRVNLPNQAPKIMTGNWEDVVMNLLANDRFGMQIIKSGFYKRDLTNILAQHKTPEQQVRAIYEFVKGKMTWNEQNSYLARTSLSDAYSKGTGNAADINLLLVAMLKEAGIDAAPVLVSTRANGRPPQGSPLVNKFNYVIARVFVDNKEYLLDATDPFLPFGMLPVRALNGNGYIVKKNEHRWVDLKPVVYSKFINTDVTISENGDMSGQAVESAGGHYALTLRKSLKEQGEEKFAENMSREVGNYKLGKPVFENKEKIGDPLHIKYNISASGNGQQNSIIYLNPLMGHGDTENPFKLTERLYPVDFATPIDETIITKYIIPAGYVIDEAPKSVNVLLPENGGKFMYMVQQNGNELQVMSRVNINKPVFYAEEYVYLKEFYNQIVAKHAEQIVLKKSSSN
ncbi:DUF3857 domain-containing protein [Pontibacter sp. BT310]|uniref:DUF3857 domain-containing protein n=1 Tax=Pontibacter populi TaxID=890055 RepID=A0ABS6XE51_9BACT|nr:MULTISPECIES: DUF3857 domain-containing protein [Pontibacter]MBJ6119381.1 DUF3857 domain-containing protein [Pontibacter sp. BT310]MBR0571809.1 DUF3857 domain-containing protein [Microvirga sp. STS03]MBW3366235.1 DUF3857 domain-containing protein [Pontibacter populi]